MSILSWILLGLIAGYVSSVVVNRHGSGILWDIVIGIVGALVGGFVCQSLGLGTVSGFNLYSLLVAIGGAILLLLIWHFIRRATAPPPH